MKKLIFLGLLLFAVGCLEAAVRHVPAEYATIQAGIDAAQTGDSVLVAAGLYSGPGNADIDFRGKAITVTSEEGPSHTVVDLLDVAHGFIFQSGETNASVLDGFRIVNAYADVNQAGGGILCYQSSPVIRNNVITHCYAYYGGGIGILGGAPVIENNQIVENVAERGGGIACLTNTQAQIRSNTIRRNLSEGT